jgi:hypothetical protein
MRSTTAFTASGRLMAVENVPRGDHDADALVRFRLEHSLGSGGRQVLAHGDGVERMIVLVLADQALQLIGELAAALQRGDQPALQREFRGVAAHRGERRRGLRHVVGEGRGGQGAHAGHVALIRAPQRVEPRRALLALARGHVAARVLIGEALEGAGAKDVHVDAELVDRFLQEHPVIAESV